MKKAVFFLIASLLVVSTFAQKTQSASPYLSASVSVSSNTATDAVELGCYDNNNWYAVTVENSPSVDNTWYAGLKYYHKLQKVGKSTDFYGFGAIKANVEDPHDLVLEPGVAFVVNLGRTFALQASVSSPIRENTVLFKPVTLSAGLGLNWWIGK